MVFFIVYLTGMLRSKNDNSGFRIKHVKSVYKEFQEGDLL